jgi:hypothetical protein
MNLDGGLEARARFRGSRALWRHEARALLPFWIGGLLAASLGALPRADVFGAARLALSGMHTLSLVASLAAIVGLGAQAIGHEYTHGTLARTLMLPVSRRRLLITKLVVLAPLVLSLALHVDRLQLFSRMPALPWLAAGAALCLSPLLTMLCRGALAGAVFAPSLPAFLLVVITIVTTYYDRSDAAELAARQIWSWLMLPVLAGCAFVGWRLFMRLESIDGGAKEINLRWLRRTDAVTPGHPLWQLAKKELRLQQMSFVLTAMFAAASLAAALYSALIDDGGSVRTIVATASTMYWLALPVLVGSLAIAEERQSGTLAWQILLPTPACQQWAVKTAVVFIVAWLLAIGVPFLLSYVLEPAGRPSLALATLLVVVTTAASLYASSLSASAVRAAMTSLVAVPLGFWVVVLVAMAVKPGPVTPAFWNGREGVWMALLGGLVLLLLGFSFANHRPAPPAAAQIRRQVLSLVALVGVAVLAF